MRSAEKCAIVENPLAIERNSVKQTSYRLTNNSQTARGKATYYFKQHKNHIRDLVSVHDFIQLNVRCTTKKNSLDYNMSAKLEGIN